MPSGGRRLGAGRRSDADILRIRAIVDKYVTNEDWGAMINAMKEAAVNGNVHAYIALWDRGLGPPSVSVPPDPEEQPLLIRTISIVKPIPDPDSQVTSTPSHDPTPKTPPSALGRRSLERSGREKGAGGIGR